MSANRTLVQLLAVETIASAEAVDLGLDAPLLSLEPGELGVPPRKRSQILGYEGAYRTALLRRADTRGTVDAIGN
ncbi:MAG TPA: hypothetical protein VGI24_12775 [Solirubrobacteraceae bacterium]